MAIEGKKAYGIVLLSLLLLLASRPASARADSDWALFTANPPAGTSVKQGDVVAYTLLIQVDADDEQMLRIQTPAGVTLSENAFIYRPVNAEGEYSAIWGSDGCVLTLPVLAKGDMLMFVARVTDAANGELICTVTWDDSALSLSHPCDAPVPSANPSTVPETALTPDASWKESVPSQTTPVQPDLPGDAGAHTGESPVENAPPPQEASSATVEKRQMAALLLCAALLSASCVGLVFAIRRYRRHAPKNKN